MANILLVLISIICITSLVGGIFFILRSIIRYKGWRSGDKDEIWSFIALLLGGIDTIIIGIIGIHLLITGSDLLLGILVPTLLLIGLIPIALFTIYYLRKLK